jgi:hypothetical protein
MKKNKTPFLLVALLFCSYSSLAQNVVGGVNAKGMDMNTYPYGTISQFGLPEKTTTGSSYLYEDWKLGTIVVSGNRKIKDYPVKYDILNQVVEVNTDKGIRILELKNIDSLLIKDIVVGRQLFLNAKKFEGAKAQILGLVELIHNHNLLLLKYHYVYIKEGAYNAALDMGNNEIKYLVRSKYFFFGNGLTTLTEIPKTKKKLVDLINNKDKITVDTFISENRLSLKEETDLKTICDFLHQKQIYFKAM